MSKNKFHYNPTVVQALVSSISIERLSAYLEKTSDNREKALELYAWNTEISAELYAPLQGLEITMRNAMHRELSSVYGVDWYDKTPKVPLTENAIKKISHAKHIVQNNGNTVDSPHIVAELSFGFWIALLGHGYQRDYHNKLWTPALHKAFPNIKMKRKSIHKRLDDLRILRNRIAHHEPIFTRDLRADYISVKEVISWICPDTAEWVDHHNFFSKVFSQKPTQDKWSTSCLVP